MLSLLLFCPAATLCFLALCLSLLTQGGYNIRKTLHGKGVCVSLATGYKGTLFESYNLELNLKPTLRISRHDIPPFIPLNSLARSNNMQTDLKAFLDHLSQHLNAYVGRRQQLKLVKVPLFVFSSLNIFFDIHFFDMYRGLSRKM